MWYSFWLHQNFRLINFSKTSAESTKDNIVTYTVDLNQNKKQFNDGENLTLSDKVPEGCTYVPKSLKFVEWEDAVISHEYHGTVFLFGQKWFHLYFRSHIVLILFDLYWILAGKENNGSGILPGYWFVCALW